MRVLNVIAVPMNRSRAGTIIKSGFSVCWLVLVSLCIWVPRPSVAECAPERTTASPRQIPPSAAGTVKPASRFGGSVTRKAEGAELDQELSALNLLGIRYAKGQGVKRNPGLAMRFFLRSAIQGYTPAMANLGTLYEIGAIRQSDFQRAYAWVRAALWFDMREEDHDETVLKLWMIAARLGPDRIESAERLADVIAARIVESCKCSPGQEPELASNHFL
jgi:Sel1 repeat-containing protein